MNGNSGNNPHIIGLTGSFGSGCTYIAEKVLSPKGYEHLSLSKDVLRPLFQKETGNNPDNSSRHSLQEFGDQLRDKEGPTCLAKKAIDKIKDVKDYEKKKWVIDSIRNPHEVRAMREFSRNFFCSEFMLTRKRGGQELEINMIAIEDYLMRMTKMILEKTTLHTVKGLEIASMKQMLYLRMMKISQR
jgi:hypothetical protein